MKERLMGEQDRYVTVDGLKIRYIEDGDGMPALLLHGASLGSSADVFRRNMGPLARGGIRAIAYDHPGFGHSDNPTDHSNGYRRTMVLKLMDALKLDKAAIIAHSQAGGMAVQIALQNPDRVTHLMVLATGSLLPPLEEKKEGRDAALQQRVDRMVSESEPTLELTRKQLESTLYHHDLITDDELALRQRHSTGKNFEAHLARTQAGEGGGGGTKPLWQRLTEIKMPFVFMVGRDDRGQAEARAELLKQTHPNLDVRIVDHCKHLLPWDGAHAFENAALALLISR